MSEDMVERVARAILASREARGDIRKQMYWQTVADTAWKSVEPDARAVIEAMREPSDAFLALVTERMHDARFSRSGETYPVPRNFLRAVVDAALSPPLPVGENND